MDPSASDGCEKGDRRIPEDGPCEAKDSEHGRGGCLAISGSHQRPHASLQQPLSTRMIGKIVKKYVEYSGLGDLSPHDLSRTAITRALDQGFSICEVQMMSGHKDIRSLMKYDH